MLFSLNLKLHHWSLPPWRLYACAHNNRDIAVKALEECLMSDNDHPRVRTLMRLKRVFEFQLAFERLASPACNVSV